MEDIPQANQSEFYHEVSTQQAPPETLKAKPTIEEEKIRAQKSRKVKLIPIMSLLGITLLLIVLVLLSKQAPVEPIIISPTPTPQPYIPPNELKNQLEVVDEAVKTADPLGDILEPPPVDMQVIF